MDAKLTIEVSDKADSMVIRPYTPLAWRIYTARGRSYRVTKSKDSLRCSAFRNHIRYVMLGRKAVESTDRVYQPPNMVAIRNRDNSETSATEDFTALAQFIRPRSEYYARLWKDVPIGETDIKKYPMVDHQSFWDANTILTNMVETQAQEDGVIFKTGGNSYAPR